MERVKKDRKEWETQDDEMYVRMEACRCARPSSLCWLVVPFVPFWWEQAVSLVCVEADRSQTPELATEFRSHAPAGESSVCRPAPRITVGWLGRRAAPPLLLLLLLRLGQY